MEKTKFIRLLCCILGTLTVLTGLSGCDAIRAGKRKVKEVLFGVKLEDQGGAGRTAAGSGRPEDKPYSELEPPPEVTQKQKLVANITPKSKVLNVCRAWGQSPDATTKGILAAEIKKSGNVFGVGVDEELISCIYLLIPWIREGQTDAVDLIFEWYAVLGGDNKEEAGKILATALDYIPGYFIKKYSEKFKYKNCSFAKMILPTVEVEQRHHVLEERVAAISKSLEEFKDRETLLEKSFGDVCIRTIELDLPSATATPQAEIPTPTPFPTPTYPPPSPAPENP